MLFLYCLLHEIMKCEKICAQKIVQTTRKKHSRFLLSRAGLGARSGFPSVTERGKKLKKKKAGKKMDEREQKMRKFENENV